MSELAREWEAACRQARRRTSREHNPQSEQSRLGTILKVIERGGIRKAGKLVTSLGMGDTKDPRVVQQLQNKHPKRLDKYEIEGDIDAYTPETTHEVDKYTLLRVMGSLPNMRAPGPDGLRYEHIKLLASAKLEDTTRENILGGVDLLLQEMMGDALPHWFMREWQSARLVAPIKTTPTAAGGAPDVRPMAIAGAWCRLFDKYVATEDYALHLLPAQLGVGFRGTSEILV